jgi:hypothetical protein
LTVDDRELSRLLDELQAATELPHVRRMTTAVALISTALRARGMEATLVGGGAIEFHAPGAYTTSDIDLVVEGKTRAELDAVLRALGFARRGRHWVRGDLFVEVPGHTMQDPTEAVRVGEFTLRVIRKEIALADRIVGFKHWRVTAYGSQALAMIAAFGDSLDEHLLRRSLRAEDAEDAYDALRRIVATQVAITDDLLQLELERLLVRGDRPGDRTDER